MVADVDDCLARLRGRPPVPLTELEMRQVCEEVKDLLLEESNVISVAAPVTICGDIHGQYFDLLELFSVGGSLDTTNYIFLGDYVDRGFNSVETFEYLLLLKLKYPNKIFLLRGNHESRQITQAYGFYDEVMRKYGGATVWRLATDLFDYMSLAAVVEQQIFCVHGGLSPSVCCIEQIRLINRLQEIPHNGPFADLVWSDPEGEIKCWAQNPRGAGWLFGGFIAREFNHVNGVSSIVRAHQLAMAGFQYAFDTSLAEVITIWSAPNYCYRCGNVAAVMKVREGTPLQKGFEIFRETEESRSSAAAYSALSSYFL